MSTSASNISFRFVVYECISWYILSSAGVSYLGGYISTYIIVYIQHLYLESHIFFTLQTCTAEIWLEALHREAHLRPAFYAAN